MTLAQFLTHIRAGGSVEFDQTMAVIDANYDYFPTRFHNGEGDARLTNEAGQNGGSCKIFSFARLHQLDQQQTLELFGRYYREDVRLHPEAKDHGNIRNFIRFGWDGISFDGEALRALEC